MTYPMMKRSAISVKLISLIVTMGLLTTMSTSPMVVNGQSEDLSGSATVIPICGVAVSDNSIEFGSFAPTSTTQTTTQTTTLSNSGNVNALTSILGTDWAGTAPATPSVMPVSATVWSAGAASPSTPLSTTASTTFTVPQVSAIGVAGTTALNLAIVPNLQDKSYNGPIAQTITLTFTCAAT